MPSDNSAAHQLAACYGRNMTFPRQQHPMYATAGHSASGSSMRRQELPALITEGEASGVFCVSGEQAASSCAEGGHLSQIMPDVAMATSSMGQLQINDGMESLQLDLGDGSSHMLGAAAAGISVHGMQVRLSTKYPSQSTDSHINLCFSIHLQHHHMAGPHQVPTYHHYVRRPTSPSPYVLHRQSPGPGSYHSGPPRFL